MMRLIIGCALWSGNDGRYSNFYLHEQYLEDFLNLKVDRDNVFLGSGLVGGEYTEPVAMV